MTEATVVFRCDASPRIGGGHVMRCMALANVFRNMGVGVWFACRTPTMNTIPALRDSGHSLIELPPEGDERPELLASAHEVTWLIVDHYELDANWMTPLRGWASHILVIDDLANRPLDCDVLLDQTYGRKVSDYHSYTPHQCVFLLGPEYALLRPEFSLRRAQALTHRTLKVNGPINVFVSLGATDPDNVTETVLESLNAVQMNIKITVVLGSAAPHLKAIRKRIGSLRHPASLKVDVAEMETLMIDVDIAIGASGTSSWERCCLGVPTIAIELADNQRHISAALDEAGAILSVGRQQDLTIERLSKAFIQLASSPQKLERMSEVASRICDGQGTTRVAEFLSL